MLFEVSLFIVCVIFTIAYFIFISYQTSKKKKECQNYKEQLQYLLYQIENKKEQSRIATENLEKYKEEENKIQSEYISQQKAYAEELARKNELEQKIHSLDIQLRDYNISLEQKYAEARDKFNDKVDALASEILPLAAQVDEYKKRQQILTNTFLDRQKQQEKDDYYSILLLDEDKEDIKILKDIAVRINRKDVVNKIIWTVYYQQPFNSLLNKIFQDKKKVCGIYRITNKTNHKIYIGQSRDIRERMIQHVKSALEIGSIAKTNLYKAMKEENIDNFTFEIIEECNLNELNDKEKYWIQFFQSNIYGYNMKI